MSSRMSLILHSAVALFLPLLAAAQPYPDVMWWYDLDAPSLGSAAVGDIDGDGLPEIVFGTYYNDEKIHALNGEDGSQLWEYNTGTANDASCVIWDVDDDGELEVVAAASWLDRIYCFEGATGAVEWSSLLGSLCHTYSPPAVADIDQDSLPEIVVGTYDGGVHALNGENGSPLWNVDLGSANINSYPSILDLDGDGDLEVVVAEWLGLCRVIALHGSDGSTMWTSTVPTDDMYHGCSFADIDGDWKPELTIGSYDNHVYCLNGEDGSECWDFYGSYDMHAPTSLADLNGDGLVEVMYAGENQVGMLNSYGTGVWAFWADGGVSRGCAIADLDADDTPDVVFGSYGGDLYARKGSAGQLLWTMDLKALYSSEYHIDFEPVIADLDGNGSLDVFVIGGFASQIQPIYNHGRAYAISGGPGTGPGWPMFAHDERHSGCYEGYQTGSEPAPPAERALLTVSPNPSIGFVTAGVCLSSACCLELSLYDMSGRLVGGRGESVLAEGEHSLTIGAAAGGPLPAGQYLLVLRTDEVQEAAKALILP